LEKQKQKKTGNHKFVDRKLTRKTSTRNHHKHRKITPSPEIKYRPTMVTINIILRKNPGKMFSEDMKYDG